MNVDFDLHVAAATVVVEGTDWVSGSHTNLATNPSFEASGATVEVFRNLATNPRFATDADIPPGTSREPHPLLPAGSYALVIPAAPTGFGYGSFAYDPFGE